MASINVITLDVIICNKNANVEQYLLFDILMQISIIFYNSLLLDYSLLGSI